MEKVESYINAAIQARENAYAPYSQFKVGAVIVDHQDQLHLGCNVENSAFSPSNCAERTALFRAIADGRKVGSFKALVVVADMSRPIPPCGVCRQVLAELCPPDMPIVMANLRHEYEIKTVEELLPDAFRLKRRN